MYILVRFFGGHALLALGGRCLSPSSESNQTSSPLSSFLPAPSRKSLISYSWRVPSCVSLKDAANYLVVHFRAFTSIAVSQPAYWIGVCQRSIRVCQRSIRVCWRVPAFEWRVPAIDFEGRE